MGYDCYRTMESFMIGAVPILYTSTMDRSWLKLPVVFIDTIEDMTKDFLQKQFERLCSKRHEFEYERLTTDYWRQLILDTRDKGIKHLNAKHPIKFENFERIYTRNRTQMEKMWRYIRLKH